MDSVEQADVCYWDAGDGDEVQWVEAVLELCAEYRVPLLQARRGAAAMRLAAPWAAKGSAEASALHLAKLGGTHLGAGKLAGLSSGLGWADDLAPQEPRTHIGRSEAQSEKRPHERAPSPGLPRSHRVPRTHDL